MKLLYLHYKHMKKILSTLLLILFISTNFSWAGWVVPGCSPECGDGFSCVWSTCVPTSTTTAPPKEPTDSPVNGITINEKCLLNGQCKYNIYDTLDIRKSVRTTGDPTSVGLFLQDIVLSATFFIGTIVTLALIVSGLMYIFAGATGKDPSLAKKGISWSLIGLLIVSSSYLIIRLVQYIAKGM